MFRIGNVTEANSLISRPYPSKSKSHRFLLATKYRVELLETSPMPLDDFLTASVVIEYEADIPRDEPSFGQKSDQKDDAAGKEQHIILPRVENVAIVPGVGKK
jgi:hypothetical protein